MRTLSVVLAALVSAAACTASGEDPAKTPTYLGEPIVTRASPPDRTDPDACFGHEATPAVIETVTSQIMLRAAEIAPDGTVLSPATFRTDTRQEIVTPRREMWFETVCTADLTPEFIASLQRALEARGLYAGPIDGEMTAATRAAIRAYQAPQGLASPILSLAAARQLGLAEVAHGDA